MKLSDFIAKYNGKFVEYHSYSSNSLSQCVDLANQWITEGLGLNAIIGTNAQDFPKKAGSQFTYTLNTPTGQPEPGDLMIFKSADGVGHISIHVKNISLSLFTSFDQNFPLKSPCKEVNHNYTNVLGWLRAKGVTTSDNIEQLKKDLAEQQQQVRNYVEQVKELVSKNEEITKQLTETTTASNGFRNQYNDFVANLAQKLGTRQNEIEILASIDTCLTYEQQVDELARVRASEAQQYAKMIDSLTSEVSELKSKVANLENKIANLPKQADNIVIPKKSIFDFMKGLGLWR